MVTLVFVLRNTFLYKILLEHIREFIIPLTCFQKIFEIQQEERPGTRKEPFLFPWLCAMIWPRYKATNIPFSHILNKNDGDAPKITEHAHLNQRPGQGTAMDQL